MNSNYEDNLLREALEILSFNEDNTESDFLVVMNRLTVLYASSVVEAVEFFEDKEHRLEFYLDYYRNFTGIAELIHEKIVELDLSVGDNTIH